MLSEWLERTDYLPVFTHLKGKLFRLLVREKYYNEY